MTENSSTLSGSTLPVADLTSQLPLVPADMNVNEVTTTPSTSVEETTTLRFVFVPLGVVMLVLIFSALVFLLVRKKRLDRLRHHLMPLYNFDPAEEGEDWETELLEEGIDHRNMRRGYKSMEFPSTENTELFGR